MIHIIAIIGTHNKFNKEKFSARAPTLQEAMKILEQTLGPFIENKKLEKDWSYVTINLFNHTTEAAINLT